MSLISLNLGTVRSEINGKNLGCVTAVDLDMSTAVVSTYKNGTIISPKSHKLLKPYGVLSITTEEFGNVTSIIADMLNNLAVDSIEAVNFDCFSITGKVYLIPQFSFSLGSWTSITIKPIVKNFNFVNKPSPSSVIQSMPNRAITDNTDNLCYAIDLNGKLLSSLTFDTKCNYELIFDSYEQEILDCVINSFSVEINAGIIDFESTDIPTEFDLNFNLIGGLYQLKIKDAIGIPQGFKSSKDYNTWHVKIIGSL